MIYAWVHKSATTTATYLFTAPARHMLTMTRCVVKFAFQFINLKFQPLHFLYGLFQAVAAGPVLVPVPASK